MVVPMRSRPAVALVVVAVLIAAGCSSTSAPFVVSQSPQTSPSPSSLETPSTTSPGPSPPGAAQSSVCRDPREHVYNPDRLHLVSACMTVTGTIEVIRNEKDGDYHILLRLDNGYGNLVNNANISSQHGDLVLEPVCEFRVTQRDAVSSCAGVAPSVPRPALNSHVGVTGAYVLDSVHGWMELHPVWDIHTT